MSKNKPRKYSELVNAMAHHARILAEEAKRR
jgi:hypothetical protein